MKKDSTTLIREYMTKALPWAHDHQIRGICAYGVCFALKPTNIGVTEAQQNRPI